VGAVNTKPRPRVRACLCSAAAESQAASGARVVRFDLPSSVSGGAWVPGYMCGGVCVRAGKCVCGYVCACGCDAATWRVRHHVIRRGSFAVCMSPTRLTCCRLLRGTTPAPQGVLHTVYWHQGVLTCPAAAFAGGLGLPWHACFWCSGIVLRTRGVVVYCFLKKACVNAENWWCIAGGLFGQQAGPQGKCSEGMPLGVTIMVEFIAKSDSHGTLVTALRLPPREHSQVV
jgi:hypothetical protein